MAVGLRSMSGRLVEEAGRFDCKLSGESFDRVERWRIGCAFKKTDIVAVESGTVRQFLLRKPTGVSQSP